MQDAATSCAPSASSHSLAEGHDIEFNNLCAEAEQQVVCIQEIVLTGVNLGTYDLEGRNLVDVVDFLDLCKTYKGSSFFN